MISRAIRETISIGPEHRKVVATSAPVTGDTALRQVVRTGICQVPHPSMQVGALESNHGSAMSDRRGRVMQSPVGSL